MRSLIAVVYRALVTATVVPVLFARPLAAQNSQIAVADAGHLSIGMQGFERRRLAGYGAFIADSALRAAPGARLATVLEQHIPGLNYGPGAVAGEFPLSSRICSGGPACASPRCYVRIFIDGMRLYDGTTAMRDVEGVDVSHLRTDDFSGVEYYAGAAGLPVQYTGVNSECGTLLLWSREP
jgi:hypothetical protein